MTNIFRDRLNRTDRTEMEKKEEKGTEMEQKHKLSL